MSRPVLGLGGPVNRVRLEQDDLGPVLTVGTARASVGLRQLVIRQLPSTVDRAVLEQITDLGGDGADVAIVIIGSETSSAGDMYALRSLVRIARTTATADEFIAVVLRSSAGFRQSAPGTVTAGARTLLTTLNEGASTNERRARLHARLRRLLVPRPGELSGELRGRTDGTERGLQAESLYERALRRWPEPFDYIAASDEVVEQPAGRVVALPGTGHPAEEKTRIRYIYRL